MLPKDKGHIDFLCLSITGSRAMADLHIKILEPHPLPGPSSFNFMQFWIKIWQNRMLLPCPLPRPLRVSLLSSENLGSATDGYCGILPIHWFTSTKQVSYILRRKRSCGKVMFSVVSVSLSVHRVKSPVIQCPSPTPPPPWKTCSNLFIMKHVLSTSGRFASYWNAFLFHNCRILS